MRARALFAGLGLFAGSANASAQLPQIPAAVPGNPGTSSTLPIVPVGQGQASPGQPFQPMSNSTPAPFPVAPSSSYPAGTPPAGSPLSPQNPFASPGMQGYPQLPNGYFGGGNPSAMQPLIPNGPNTASLQSQGNPVAQPLEVALPRPENKFAINVGDVSLKRMSNGWQLWMGTRLLRDFGDKEMDARDALRVYRDLRPTEWATIGAGKPIVEYGLINGRTPMSMEVPTGNDKRSTLPILPTGDSGPLATGAGAKQIVPIDLRTVRVETIRGVWCLRDDSNILLNFGVDKPDAEQSLAVVRKYGFNRLGIVGNPAPAMTYFFAAPDAGASQPKTALALISLQNQIESLARTGIPVGGLGFVGEMIRLDPRTIDVRKEGGDWIVAAGSEVLGRYGPTEWMARDAARTIQSSHFTEFCKAGSSGLTFFLVNGQAPTHVPFNVQGRRFDPNVLKVQKSGEHYAIVENGNRIFDCASSEEGETLIRLLKYYQFDQLCHLGPNAKLGVSFLARSR